MRALCLIGVHDFRTLVYETRTEVKYTEICMRCGKEHK